MSQEEWVEQKREERISEFAPPVAYIEDISLEASTSSKRGPCGLFFTSKKLRTKSTAPPVVSSVTQISKQAPKENIISEIKNELSDDSPEECDEKLMYKGKERFRKGAEIPPPSTMEYYGGLSHKPSKEKIKSSSSKDIEDSISEGLKYLQKQNEIKDKKKEKGLLDII